MKKTNLAKAIAIAVTSTALSFGVVSTASAHVMYNTGAFAATDGWTKEDGRNNTGAVIPWKGTPGGVRPFGFEGLQAVNWAATLHTGTSTVEVSQADSIADYGFAADLDTANGSWGAWQVDPATPTFTRGWAHNTDYGLVKSLVDTTIQVNVSKVNSADNINNFGITVFTGMDDGTAGFSHHSAWNAGYISGLNEGPAQIDNPHGTSGLTYLTHGDQSTVTFQAVADQVYSIYLGGNDIGGDIFGTPYGYKAEISAVPVPAAVWLFGTGLFGLAGLGRRKLKDT